MHPLFFLIFHICCLVSAKKLGGGEQGHSFLVKQRNGQVFGWGSNRYGMLGIGSAKLTWPNPKKLVNVVSARDVSVSLTHSCIVDQGQTKCAGLGYFLGRTSTNIDSNVMVPVEGLNEAGMVSRVFLGEQHSCILTTAGAVWCWGYAEDGRIASPATGLIAGPHKVTGYGADKVTIDVATSDHTCILLSDGTVGCAGRNTEGQLGVEDTEDRFTLTQVQGGLVNVVSISAGTACTCAVTQNGDVYCWGSGYFGGLEVVDKTYGLST